MFSWFWIGWVDFICSWFNFNSYNLSFRFLSLVLSGNSLRSSLTSLVSNCSVVCDFFCCETFQVYLKISNRRLLILEVVDLVDRFLLRFLQHCRFLLGLLLHWRRFLLLLTEFANDFDFQRLLSRFLCRIDLWFAKDNMRRSLIRFNHYWDCWKLRRLFRREFCLYKKKSIKLIQFE